MEDIFMKLTSLIVIQISAIDHFSLFLLCAVIFKCPILPPLTSTSHYMEEEEEAGHVGHLK